MTDQGLHVETAPQHVDSSLNASNCGFFYCAPHALMYHSALCLCWIIYCLQAVPTYLGTLGKEVASNEVCR